MAGHVERLAWGGPGAAVEYSRTWFDGDKAQYVQRLTEGAAPSPRTDPKANGHDD
jgi:GntR family transcriptional regulator